MVTARSIPTPSVARHRIGCYGGPAVTHGSDQSMAWCRATLRAVHYYYIKRRLSFDIFDDWGALGQSMTPSITGMRSSAFVIQPLRCSTSPQTGLYTNSYQSIPSKHLKVI